MESYGLELPPAVTGATSGRHEERLPRPIAICPGCERTYGLPPGLLPPWGGRVRCPQCGEIFAAGVLAEAALAVQAVYERNPADFDAARREGATWRRWGGALLDGYERLRSRYGVELASRAYRQALELAAPGLWGAPPAELNPFEPLPAPNGATPHEG